MFFDLVVQIHNMQNVHQLTFVFMETFYLYIKDRIRIYFNTIVLQNVFCKTYFILVFDIHEFLLCFLIICINFQFGKLFKVCNPFISDMIGDPVCQKRVCMKQETSLCNTVCLIVEFLRIHFVEISQFLFLQDICMESCNTVHRVTACDCQMGHLNLSIIDDRHLADFFLISRIFCRDFSNKSAVDFFNNLIYTRKQFGKQFNRPFFQSFCHNCMVCICTGMGSDFPCFFPCHVFLIQKNTH